jgi:hypothetical protein
VALRWVGGDDDELFVFSEQKDSDQLAQQNTNALLN